MSSQRAISIGSKGVLATTFALDLLPDRRICHRSDCAQRLNIEANACSNQENRGCRRPDRVPGTSSMKTPSLNCLESAGACRFPCEARLTPKPQTCPHSKSSSKKRLGRRTPRRNSKYEKRATARISLNLLCSTACSGRRSKFYQNFVFKVNG